MMELKPGSRWKSAACKTEVVVVRPPKISVTLECGGHAMVPAAETPGTALLSADHSGGSMTGKRYIDGESGLEVLVAKAGEGSLAANGRPMPVKEAKALPSSD